MGHAFDLHCIGFRNLFRNFARSWVSICESALLFRYFCTSRFCFSTFAFILRFDYGRRNFHFHKTLCSRALSIRQSISEHRLCTFRNIFARSFTVSSNQTFLTAVLPLILVLRFARFLPFKFLLHQTTCKGLELRSLEKCKSGRQLQQNT